MTVITRIEKRKKTGGQANLAAVRSSCSNSRAPPAAPSYRIRIPRRSQERAGMPKTTKSTKLRRSARVLTNKQGKLCLDVSVSVD